MSLKEKLKTDLKTAMKEKKTFERDTIRSINTMIKQVEVDERKELTDSDIIKLIQRGIKQREEAKVQYTEAKREDLVDKENKQIDVFSLYLPKQLDDSELEIKIKDIIQRVGATSMKDMGKVMSTAKNEIGGSADGKRINETVKKVLN